MVAEGLLGAVPIPRYAGVRSFRDAKGHVLDKGIALFFAGPASFTGEDVLELHCHGGPVLVDALVERVIELGARLARPGEFTERAFVNGKLDLAQAEAVADLIDAASVHAARAAARSIQGVFSEAVHGVRHELLDVRAELEATLDFPEDELGALGLDVVASRLSTIYERLRALRAEAVQGTLLREGMTVVLAGPPNSGKSSLLNCLAGGDRAIVTAIPGTTRDTLRESIEIDGMPLHIVDTAGLRLTEDPVEREGVRRARAAMESADRVLRLVDATIEPTPEDAVRDRPWVTDESGHRGETWIHNKIDLLGVEPRMVLAEDAAGRDGHLGRVDIWLSARTGSGIDLLREHLKALMGYGAEADGQFIARRRHLVALDETLVELNAAQEELARTGEAVPELVAERLRFAQHSLGAIVGEVTSEELLGEIFSRFCLGK